MSIGKLMSMIDCDELNGLTNTAITYKVSAY
jgi:hypothetical protein